MKISLWEKINHKAALQELCNAVIQPYFDYAYSNRKYK